MMMMIVVMMMMGGGGGLEDREIQEQVLDLVARHETRSLKRKRSKDVHDDQDPEETENKHIPDEQVPRSMRRY